MESFFPPDQDEWPKFICTDCGIYAHVRGRLTLALVIVRAWKCIEAEHDVTIGNIGVHV